MNATVEIETVTPGMAMVWLKNKYEGQRKVRNMHVQRLVTTIRNGDWKLTCDAITIIKGKLANGQHRCEAIALAGKACQALILRTTDEKVFDVIDSGVGRTVADAMGNRLNGSAVGVAAAARIALAYDRKLISVHTIGTIKQIKNTDKFDAITRQDVISYIMDNEESLTQHSAKIASLYAKNPITSKAVATAFMHLACKKKEKEATAFIENLFNWEKPDAASDFGRKLNRDRRSASKMRSPYIMALLIKSFKAYLKNERPQQYRMGEGEEFPTL